MREMIMAAIKYIQDFFDEKVIPETTFEVEGPSGINFIPNTVVIEHIKSAPASEQKQIGNILRKIDFMNGNVNHFLEHLAGAIAI
jgi:hypothetical protein